MSAFFLHETQFVRTNDANMEEAGILEKITHSGFCYPALNQARAIQGWKGYFTRVHISRRRLYKLLRKSGAGLGKWRDRLPFPRGTRGAIEAAWKQAAPALVVSGPMANSTIEPGPGPKSHLPCRGLVGRA